MPTATGPRASVLMPELLARLLGPRLPVRAACAGMAPLHDGELPGESVDEREQRQHRARAVCAGCAALPACTAALPTLPRAARGVWAGVILAD